MGGSNAREPIHVVVLELDDRTYRNLEALTGEAIPGGILNPEDVAGVLLKLADHADQGVYRPGAWERGWLCSAFGNDWLARLEKDPRYPNISWQRPIATPRRRAGRAGSPRRTMNPMDTPRQRLRELADAYDPDRPNRGLLGDFVVAATATIHVVAVAGPRRLWWIITGRGEGPGERDAR